MKLLDRHISNELLGPFIFGVAAFTSLMFAGGEIFKITELITEYHAPMIAGLKVLLLYLPGVIVLTLPMSMLLSTLLGFGRLSGDSEVTALFASGVSLYRIAVPVAILAILVTASSYMLSELVAPRATREHQKIMRQYEPNMKNPTDKPFVVIDAKNQRTDTLVYVPPSGLKADNTLHNIVIVRFRDNKPYVLFHAKTAVYVGKSALSGQGQWMLHDGYYEALGSSKMMLLPFGEHQITVNKTPKDFALYQRKPEEMSFVELRDYIRMRQDQGEDVNEDRVQLYQKLSLPLSSLIFALIGTPLGLRPQRSSSAMGLGLSIVIIFTYWVLSHYLSILGGNGTLSPATACFLPNLAGALTGIGLIYKAAK